MTPTLILGDRLRIGELWPRRPLPPSHSNPALITCFPHGGAGTGYPAYNAVKPGMLILDDLDFAGEFQRHPDTDRGKCCHWMRPEHASRKHHPATPRVHRSELDGVDHRSRGRPDCEHQRSLSIECGPNGVLNSSFQSTSGTLGFPATTNWIAIAWDAASGITKNTVGNYTEITFVTISMGDTLVISSGAWCAGYARPRTNGDEHDDRDLYVWNGGDRYQHRTHHAGGWNLLRLHRRCSDGSYREQLQRQRWKRLDGEHLNVLAFYWNSGGRISTSPATNSTALLIAVNSASGFT